MTFQHTKLNPTAPSFAAGSPTLATGEVPPTPPPADSPQELDDSMSLATINHSILADWTVFDTSSLPDWAYMAEDEKRRIICVTLHRKLTRDKWFDRLHELAEIVAPGHHVTSSSDSNGKREPWKPLAVRSMPAPLNPDVTAHTTTFSTSFLQSELRGRYWSPGFYLIHPSDRRPDLSFTAYWLLETDLDPYLPAAPGQHGAKLTPFFNSTLSEPGEAPTEADYMNTPVFVGKTDGSGYRYFGHYSQTRFSDKLDYERMTDGTVPPFVLDVWAKSLVLKEADPWMRDALREHIWPKPTYCGPLPLSPRDSSPVDKNGERRKAASNAHDRCVERAIQRYLEQLEEWEVDTKLKLSFLKEADIHRLFRAADADEEPALRFWFEYLECVAYDEGFYAQLAELSSREHLQRGAAERNKELEQMGWRWQMVEKTSGSGHPYKVEELRPPPPALKVPFRSTREDSVVGADQAATPKPNEKREPETMQTQGSAPTPSVLPSKSIPPHLRAKQQRVMQQTPSISQAQPSHTASNTPRTSPFSAADLEEARRLNASFTKAKPRGRGARDEDVQDGGEERGWARTGGRGPWRDIKGREDVKW